MTTIAINGFGGIGRAALKIILDTPQLEYLHHTLRDVLLTIGRETS